MSSEHQTENERVERHPDWEQRLVAFLKEHQDQPFEWGTHDCGIFVAQCLEVIKPVSVLPYLQNKFASKEEADQFIENHGGTLESVASEFLGKPIPRMLLRRGDIAIGKFFSPSLQRLYGPEAETFALCMGHQCVTVGDTELVYKPLLNARVGWYV